MSCPNCGTENDENSPICSECGRYLGALERGTILSERYEILDLLGMGGLGRVYRAKDRTLDEVVALKVLHPEAARSPELTRRFFSEIKLARKVRHRNVCAIHEYGEDGSFRFIAMELVDGVDVARTLREEGPLPPRDAFDIAIQVAKGLEAIHEAGVVHRDLKTPNIMRDMKGDVRLLDFGIAKRTSPHGTLAMTADQKVVGTPEYMSPEQIRGGEADPRTDIYALGIVLYEMFTGVVPFQGKTALDTLLKHINEAPPLASEQAARIPRSVLPVLRKALAKDPKERYGSAHEMLEALRVARSVVFPDSTVTPETLPTMDPDMPEPGFRTSVLPKPSPGSRTPPSVRDLAAQAALEEGRTYVELPPVGAGEPEATSRGPSSAAPGGGRSRAPWVWALIGATAVAGFWALRSRGGASKPAPEPTVVAVATPSAAPTALPSSPEPRVAPTPAPSLPASSPSPWAVEWPPYPTPPSPSPVPTAGTESPSPEPEPTPSATPVPRRSPRIRSTPIPTPTPNPAPPPVAALELAVDAGAEVEVDGRIVGTAPLEVLTLDPGVRRLRFLHPEYWPFQRLVTLEPGRTFRLNIDLQWEAVRRTGLAPYKVAAAEAPTDPYFERGERQLAEGTFREAVLTLEPVVRRLSVQGNSRKELARAEFYLGVAYLELDRQSNARAYFARALEHDSSLKPQALAFPPKVMTFFNHVKEELKRK